MASRSTNGGFGGMRAVGIERLQALAEACIGRMRYAALFLLVARTECIEEEGASPRNQPRKFLVRLASRETALTVCETVLKHRCLVTHPGATSSPLFFVLASSPCSQ